MGWLNQLRRRCSSSSIQPWTITTPSLSETLVDAEPQTSGFRSHNLAGSADWFASETLGNSPSSSYQPIHAPSCPHVTPLLRIHPPEVEKRFWKSTTCQQSMRNNDMFFSLYVVFNNLMLLRFNKSKLPPEALPYFRELCWVYILLGILQTACAIFPAVFGHRARSILVIINRTLRLAQTTLNIIAIRACILTPVGTAFLRAATLHPQSTLPPLLTSLRALYLTTGSFISFLHPTSQRLRLRPQLAFQLAYLLATFLLASVPAAHFLSSPLHAPSIALLCTATNSLSSTLIAAATGMYTAPADPCATPLAPWLLVLFTQAYFGFVIPLAITCSLERSLKATYLTTELGHTAAAPASSAMTLAQTMLLLLLSGAACWQLVLMYHCPLVRWALPLDWDGASSGWYHDLLHRRALGVC